MVGTTQQNEELLFIQPRRTYFYLGRTNADFGQVGFAIKFEALQDCEVSPCDTGGLNQHTKPVSDWPPNERRGYLQQATWAIAEMGSLLAQYPGVAPADLERYLDVGRTPIQTGPHKIWPRCFEADIWLPPNTWQSWTWEARPSGPVQTGPNVVAWACSGPLQESILDQILQHAGEEEEGVSLAGHLLDKYVDGGVGQLIEEMRVRQLSEYE